MSYRFSFILPHETNVPIGGYKVIYEFANELVKRDHKVSIVLPKLIDARTGFTNEIKNVLWPKLHKLRNPAGITWFKLDPRVEVILCSDLREKWLPPSDMVFASSFRTVPVVAGYSSRMGRKFYLIQGLETYAGPYDQVIGSWKTPVHNIVIAKWLEDFSESLNEPYTRIKIGVDLHDYGLDRPIANRGHRVAMMFHENYVKGSWDGINALEVAKERVSDLTVVLFGVPARPLELPTWMEYVQKASAPQLREIYNSASIFLHPSWTEGWPMPPAEAMACGAAIVAASNPGAMDYLKPGITAIVSRPKYWTELADNLVTLLTDEPKRIAYAEAGNEDIQQYTWDNATESLLKAIG